MSMLKMEGTTPTFSGLMSTGPEETVWEGGSGNGHQLGWGGGVALKSLGVVGKPRLTINAMRPTQCAVT